jgi:iodotyrosine deiodinase
VVVSAPEIKRQDSPRRGSGRKENYERRFPQEWPDALAALETDWHKEFLEIAPWLIVVFRRGSRHYQEAFERIGRFCGMSGAPAGGRELPPHQL